LHRTFAGNPDYKNNSLLLNIDKCDDKHDILVYCALGECTNKEETAKQLRKAFDIIIEDFTKSEE
jgi:hypothetical protein